ncbi:hypothetical protein CRG98_015564 [Punica granatum]|uniref:Zinc finger, CCHC-type n=1 Tax=Punica granatum TaxID=22663 RepID=A0A2I0K644_PUNGR|nr:hypothetical protein CRG98_015564 [Punica granatum]
MALSESFQVVVVIEKLPPGWKDFKNYLKHKRNEMTMDDLLVKLLIEEDNKNFGKDLILPAAAKKGHTSADCKLPKSKKDHEANMINEMARDVAGINLSAVVSEVNLIGSNPKQWWLDIGAPRHMCSNRDLFTMLELVTMGNFAHFYC